MKRLILVTCVAAFALLLPLRAVAQPAHADSKKATLTVTADLAVGSTVLPAGEYRVQCRMIDGKTYLVVVSAESGKEAARVPCVLKALDNKVADSQFVTEKDASGRRVLSSVRIKGESAEHRVAN